MPSFRRSGTCRSRSPWQRRKHWYCWQHSPTRPMPQGIPLQSPLSLFSYRFSSSQFFYRILLIAIATRFSRREMKVAMTGPKILIIATNGKTSVFYLSCVGQISDSPEKWYLFVGADKNCHPPGYGVINGLINKLWRSQRGSNPRFRREGTRHVEKILSPQDPLRANRGHDRRADGS